MTLYLDSLQPLLPDDIRKQLDHSLLPEIKTIVETLLRLAVGAEAPKVGALPDWAELQPRASKIVDDLKRSEYTRPGQKRPRDDDSTMSSKRARTDDAPPPAADDDDSRVYSLHGISVSTPIRKKVNIDIHRSSIRLTNPASHKEEYLPIPLSTLRRAFLLPTRGKSKPHWSVVLLSSDVPTPLPKGAAAAKDKDTTSPQLVFGLDATLTAVLTTSTADSIATHPKGQPSLPALRTFLSHLPVPTHEPSTAVFRSAAGSQEGSGVAGVEAYRGAKEGTLWFLDDGVLWDGKPCEFFALQHLAPASKGQGGDQVFDGVRTLTATGRTCSVILRRIGSGGSPANGQATAVDGKAKGKKADAMDEDADEVSGDEKDEAVDVDFGMVDGREQEPIGRWIKARRNRFGRVTDPSATADGDAAGPSSDAKGKGKAVAREADPRNEDTDDEEDDDFEVTGTDVSDEDSGTESESDASEDEGEGDEANASDEATGDEMDAEEEELDPKHHPLLRPGAMPRMSRAAVEAVVGMVEQDMMGGGRRGGGAAGDSDEDEDEEDELDD
ncbi:hypothetical protein LXA43DRAFT_404996 [Ganoderma leucocontextum]|nr:hypothetical protein LXA43DRAFT_404996 [Ganoderma leucocontextum]